MKKSFAILAIVGLSGSVFATGNTMPPRSFLVSPVRSVNELVRQLENPSVLNAYVRHYGSSPQEIAAFFRTLHIGRAGKTYRVPVYFYDRTNGKINSRAHTIQANDLFFVTKSGVPIMMVKCGNPLGTKVWMPKKTPDVLGDEVKRAVSPDAEVAAKPSSRDLAVAKPTEVKDAAELKDLAPASQPETPTPSPEVTPELNTPSIPSDTLVSIDPGAVPTPESIPSTSLPRQGSLTSGVVGNLIGVLAVVPMISMLGSSSGSGVSTNGVTPIDPINPVNPVNPVDPTNPVPEPATLAVLGVGSVWLARRRKQR